MNGNLNLLWQDRTPGFQKLFILPHSNFLIFTHPQTKSGMVLSSCVRPLLCLYSPQFHVHLLCSHYTKLVISNPDLYKVEILIIYCLFSSWLYIMFFGSSAHPHKPILFPISANRHMTHLFPDFSDQKPCSHSEIFPYLCALHNNFTTSTTSQIYQIVCCCHFYTISSTISHHDF